MLARGSKRLSLTTASIASYIKQNDINQIQQRYSKKTILNQVKIVGAIIKIICVQGFKDGKKDIKRFSQLRKIPYHIRTQSQQNDYVSIKQDMIKSLPVFIVLNIPLGGPLFFLYIQLFPTFAPTWVLTESIYNRILTVHLQSKISAKHYFKSKFQTNQDAVLAQKIVKMYEGEASNWDLRMLSGLIMGVYQDGTFYLCHLSPFRRLGLKMGYMLSQNLSIYLLRRKIHAFVEGDTAYKQQYQHLPSFNQKMKLQLLKNLQKL